MKKIFLTTAALAFAATAGMGIANADHHGGPVKMMGDVITNHEGMTLYTFDNDTAGVSNCYDSCATSWPPLTADAGTTLPEGFSLISRTDGTMQIAQNSEPLYLWVGDSAPGHTTGDGVGGVWHTATN